VELSDIDIIVLWLELISMIDHEVLKFGYWNLLYTVKMACMGRCSHRGRFLLLSMDHIYSGFLNLLSV
jgi:hypothetical protein